MKELFHAALYIRLSREDGDREESDSVANQRAILRSYAESDLTIADFSEYIDDGWSGTDFDRPAFISMLEDLRSGKRNCVIVKDLSRFGRNYIQAGRYLEEEFPFMGVRFIALGDNIDTYLRPEQSESILLPFKNLLNDEYSRDISKKIRAALDMKRRRGDFIGSHPSYGYMRDPENRSHLVPDPSCEDTVRYIFNMYISGTSKNAIARDLNLRRIPPPAVHLRGGKGLWSASSVDRILRNPVYTGDMVQGKWGNISYKVQRSRRKPEDRWFIVRDTHKPIISREDFETVQLMMAGHAKSDTQGQIHPLAGIVRCAECGRALSRRRVKHPYGVYEYYICPTWRADKTACTKHSVRVDLVERQVLDTLRDELGKIDLESINPEPAPQTRPDSIKRSLEKIMSLKRSIYEDWKSGEISREEYLSFKSSYDREEKELRAAAEASAKSDPRKKLKGMKIPDHLERSLVLILIESVLIHSDGSLDIIFRYIDPDRQN